MGFECFPSRGDGIFTSRLKGYIGLQSVGWVPRSEGLGKIPMIRIHGKLTAVCGIASVRDQFLRTRWHVRCCDGPDSIKNSSPQRHEI